MSFKLKRVCKTRIRVEEQIAERMVYEYVGASLSTVWKSTNIHTRSKIYPNTKQITGNTCVPIQDIILDKLGEYADFTIKK